jgi:hypothetical protein
MTRLKMFTWKAWDTGKAIRVFDEIQKLLDWGCESRLYDYSPALGDWVSRPISSTLPVETLRLAHHHGFVCGFDSEGTALVCQLNIRYDASPSVSIGPKIITLASFVGDSKCFRLYARNPGIRIDAVERIKLLSHKYTDSYNLLHKNCEHFVTEALYGTAVSHQVALLLEVEHVILNVKGKAKLIALDVIYPTLQYPRFSLIRGSCARAKKERLKHIVLCSDK